MKILVFIAILVMPFSDFAYEVTKEEKVKCIESEKLHYKNLDKKSFEELEAKQDMELLEHCRWAGYYPQDVRKFISNAEDCVHFSGEISGYGTEDDKHSERIANETCLLNSEKTRIKEKLIRKYATNPAITRAVKEAADSYSTY